MSIKLSTLFTKYQDTYLLQKIETYAQWTIPSVFSNVSVDEMEIGRNREVTYDYQSVGAYNVNRLASKLARSLFPANTSFFRIDAKDPRVKAVFKEKRLDSIVEYENEACGRLFYGASYAQLLQAVRLLIVTGECLVYRVQNALRIYSLKDYVVKRGNTGDVLDIIICERKYWEELSPELQTIVPKPSSDTTTTLKLYTRIKRNTIDGIISWQLTQEINGVDLGVNTVYRDKLCPYIPVTWNFVNGDAYGRGYVEEYSADFAKLSDLSRELMSYEMESLRIVHMVNAGGGVDVEEAANAPNGEYIQGDPAQVKPYEAGVYQKIQEIRQDLTAIEQRLGIAFMQSGNTRDAERVTQYEIQINAQEAEQVLGGVYSQLAEGLHLPLAYLLLHEVRPDIIAAFDAQEIELRILTGVQALSRNTENQSFIVACTEINTVAPILAQISKRFNIEAVAKRIFLANGVNTDDIMYTDAELQAQQAQQNAALQAQQAAMQPQQLGSQEQAINALQAARTS